MTVHFSGNLGLKDFRSPTGTPKMNLDDLRRIIPLFRDKKLERNDARRKGRERKEAEDHLRESGSGASISNGRSISRKGKRKDRWQLILPVRSNRIISVGDFINDPSQSLRFNSTGVDFTNVNPSPLLAIDLDLPLHFQVRDGATWPVATLALSKEQRDLFVFIHSNELWLEMKMKRPRLLNPFKVEIPSAIERLLSLNLKFIIRPKINVVARLESFKELRTTVRRRSRFLNAPVKTGRDRYVPRLHVKSTIPYTWPKADETVEKGLDQGFLLLRQALDGVDSTRWRPNLAGATLPSLEGFMNSNNALVKAADKNLGLTVLPKDWYVEEGLRQLRDSSMYLELKMVRLRAIIKTLMYRRKRLLSKAFSFASLYQYTPFSAEKFVHQLNEDQIQLPESHMLPKMHKVKLAGRPIVPSHSWVTSHVSKYADWLLQPMLQLFPWNIQDSKDLLRRLLDLELPKVNEELWIITADIQNMYTNLPSDEGARCMRWLGTHFYTQEHLSFSQRLPPILAPMFEDFLDSGSENFGFGSAPSSEFFNTETLREQTAGHLIYELVSFVLNNSYLGLQGKLFHQVSGTAMGTALAPTYANLFVGALEREARLLETPNLIFYGRYIDDVRAIVKGPRWNVDKCISALAQLHPSLVFDAEVSSNGLPFLDAFISKNPDGKNSARWSLSTRVYQKDFNSYQYIPWSSEHPESVKSAFVKGELIRYIRLSSSRDEYITQMARFYLRLRARGYPTRWLRKAFKVVQYSDVRPVALERKQIENMGETPLIFHSDYNPVWNQVSAGLILTKTVEDWNPDLRTKLTGTLSRRIINARSRTRNLGEIVNRFNKNVLSTANTSSSTAV